MKILLLNPAVSFTHPISVDLRRRGISLLFPAHAEEAWQLLQLHGQSVDLAVIHREGPSSEPKGAALRLISRIKSDPTQSDLPIVLTTHEWKEQQCAQHQQSAEGANAYIFESLTTKNLISVIEAVLSRSFPLTQESPALHSRLSELEGHPQDSVNSQLQIEPHLAGDQSISLVQVESQSEPDTGTQIKILRAFNLEAPTSSLSAIRPDQENGNFQPNVNESSCTDEISLFSLMPGPIDSPVAPIELDANMSQISSASLGSQNNHSKKEAGQSPVSPHHAQDPHAEQIMPYVFSSKVQPLILGPLGDAAIPGGVANSPDLATLKKYLNLREQDVSILSSQLREARDQIGAVDQQLREERAKNVELLHTCQDQKKKLESDEARRGPVIEKFEGEVQDLRFQLRVKTDELRTVESQLHRLSDEMNQLKDRVRVDIRKIRVREKELETRLEITKRDSEAILASRESKMIELKRNLDVMEFNMDLLQNQYSKEKETSSKLREKVAKLAQVVKIADGLLENPNGVESPSPSEASSSVATPDKKVS